MKEVPGIYCATCSVTNKKYVGSSIRCRSRIKRHVKELRLNKHANKFLQNSWNKYGEQSFNWKLLEGCIEERLLLREQKWITELRTFDKKFGFNLTYPVKQKVAHPWASAMTKEQWKDPAYKELMTTKVSKTMQVLSNTPEAKTELKKRSNDYWGTKEAKQIAAKRMTKRWALLDPQKKAERLRGFGPRETTKWVEIKGLRKPLKHWAKESELPYGLLLTRFNRGCGPDTLFTNSRCYAPKPEFMTWLIS